MRTARTTPSRPLGCSTTPRTSPSFRASLWKVWIYDDEQQRAGGLYLFDSEEHARAFGDGILPKALGGLPGVSDIDARYYDVDEQLSAITRGPVSVPQQA